MGGARGTNDSISTGRRTDSRCRGGQGAPWRGQRTPRTHLTILPTSPHIWKVINTPEIIITPSLGDSRNFLERDGWQHLSRLVFRLLSNLISSRWSCLFPSRFISALTLSRLLSSRSVTPHPFVSRFSSRLVIYLVPSRRISLCLVSSRFVSSRYTPRSISSELAISRLFSLRPVFALLRNAQMINNNNNAFFIYIYTP